MMSRLFYPASACNPPDVLNGIAAHRGEFLVEIARHALVQWDNGEPFTHLKPMRTSADINVSMLNRHPVNFRIGVLNNVAVKGSGDNW